MVRCRWCGFQCGPILLRPGLGQWGARVVEGKKKLLEVGSRWPGLAQFVLVGFNRQQEVTPALARWVGRCLLGVQGVDANQTTVTSTRSNNCRTRDFVGLGFDQLAAAIILAGGCVSVTTWAPWAWRNALPSAASKSSWGPASHLLCNPARRLRRATDRPRATPGQSRLLGKDSDPFWRPFAPARRRVAWVNAGESLQIPMAARRATEVRAGHHRQHTLRDSFPPAREICTLAK